MNIARSCVCHVQLYLPDYVAEQAFQVQLRIFIMNAPQQYRRCYTYTPKLYWTLVQSIAIPLRIVEENLPPSGAGAGLNRKSQNRPQGTELKESGLAMRRDKMHNLNTIKSLNNMNTLIPILILTCVDMISWF